MTGRFFSFYSFRHRHLFLRVSASIRFVPCRGFQEAAEEPFEDGVSVIAEAVVSAVEPGQETGGVTAHAAVAGVLVERSIQLDAEDSNLRNKPVILDGVPEATEFSVRKISGVEAVLAGVVVTGLATAVPFPIMLWHGD